MVYLSVLRWDVPTTWAMQAALEKQILQAGTRGLDRLAIVLPIASVMLPTEHRTRCCSVKRLVFGPTQRSQRGVLGPTVGWSGPMPTAWGVGGATPHQYYKYNSLHAGKAMNFAMVDGSVRTVSPTVDNTTYQYVSAMQDGNVTSELE